ncbi:MAG: flagellin [Pseudomonadota bacterium]
MRISTQAASFAALADLMQSQRQMFDARQQVSTGLRAPDMKGYGHDAERILSGRSALTRTDMHVENLKRLDARLEVQDLAYRELSGAADDLRQALTTNDGTFMMNQVSDAFQRAKMALSTKFAGSFVFGGTQTDTEPLAADTLSDLQAAPSIADMFANSDRRQTAKLDDNTAVEISFLAEEIAGDLMGVFERVADYDDGPNGPFDGPLTSVQQTFLQTEIATVIDAFEQINQAMGANGALQARVENAERAHETRRDYLQIMIADIEDADMAEAASRFTQAQTAVEVSARTFASLSQVSLLPFLR